MPHLSCNTKLKNRTLWYDGDSTFDSQTVIDHILAGNPVKYVDKITKEIEEYNHLVSSNDSLTTKATCSTLQFDWRLPHRYDTLDVVKYVADTHEHMVATRHLNDPEQRMQRLATELVEYRERNLFDLLRVLIYVINTLLERNIAWGIGRGSSTASYLLYVIGVHDVDSFKYDLNFTDFMRDED
jgi:DNA polymerase III alpha subunit